jgi:hypothetical protein
MAPDLPGETRVPGKNIFTQASRAFLKTGDGPVFFSLNAQKLLKGGNKAWQKGRRIDSIPENIRRVHIEIERGDSLCRMEWSLLHSPDREHSLPGIVWKIYLGTTLVA